MDDATYEAQKNRVRACFDLWIPRLRLQAQRLLYVWDRGNGEQQSAGEVAFEVDADWRYLHARITAYLGSCADQTDERLEGLVVHELVHIHLNELRMDDSGFQAHEERVAESMARAFLDTYRAGRDGGVPDGAAARREIDADGC